MLSDEFIGSQVNAAGDVRLLRCVFAYKDRLALGSPLKNPFIRTVWHRLLSLYCPKPLACEKTSDGAARLCLMRDGYFSSSEDHVTVWVVSLMVAETCPGLARHCSKQRDCCALSIISIISERTWGGAMKRLIVLAVTAIAISSAAIPSNTAEASGYYWQLRKPVTLKVIQPRFSRWSTPTQMDSGWPITIEMTVNDELGLAGYTGFPPFPGQRQTGYIVFDDPDGCPTFFPAAIAPEGCPPAPLPPPDETYLEFTPDVDQPGVEDNAGNNDLRPAQVDSLGGGQAPFDGVGFDGAPEQYELGPFSGMDVEDGYGVGTPDDDLPGLVVLSEKGIGLVLDPDFNPPAVPMLRNLAGLVSSVSYELSDWTRRTTITAHFNVPRGALAPFVKIDNCVGDVATCVDNPSLWRIDGGPQETTAVGEANKELYPALFESLSYEMRFFVVSGTAPGTLADENGDGKVNSLDAEAAGYTVLSREAKIKVKQLYGDPCFGTVDGIMYADFDGNGSAILPQECPSGSGSVRPIPR